MKWRCVVLIVALCAGQPSLADLTWDERVQCHRAVGQVLAERRAQHSGLEAKTSTADLELAAERQAARVLAAGTLTPEVLEAELGRILAESRAPETLAALLATLDFDDELARECLARPLVADRLERGFRAVQQREVGRPDRTLDDFRTERAVVQCPDDSWSPVTALGAPTGGQASSVIWTGAEMIAWGGFFDGDDGGRYVPALNSWTSISTAGAPTGREGHAAFWDGSRMLLWGGWLPEHWNGAFYDPALDSWGAVSNVGAGSFRSGAATVWTGNQMIVWGGRYVDGTYPTDGLIYDALSNSWSPLGGTGAPSGRRLAQAVWTGTGLIVWGGENEGTRLGDGASYDLAEGSWNAISAIDSPTPRVHASSAWSESQWIVWGGLTGSGEVNDGARYDPEGDTWIPLPSLDAPLAGRSIPAVWTGQEFLVWGMGEDGNPGEGARYSPRRDMWAPMTTIGAPEARVVHVAVWTGHKAIFWAGADMFLQRNDGGQYCAETPVFEDGFETGDTTAWASIE